MEKGGEGEKEGRMEELSSPSGGGGGGGDGKGFDEYLKREKSNLHFI